MTSEEKRISLEDSRTDVLTLVGRAREVLRSFQPLVADDSVAAREVILLDDEAVIGILGQTALLYESVSDHVVATTRILAPPIQTLAPFSLVRSAIEVSATCCWILDRAINHTQRVSRSTALRRKGLDEQRKVARENPTIDDGGVASRYAHLEEREKRYGATRMEMPSATALVEMSFGLRSPYRLTSAVIHGHLWAVTQVAFTPRDRPVAAGTVFLEPTIKPELAVYLLILALESVARPLWLRTLYSGHDRTRTARLLEQTYDAMQIAETRRFWRTT